MPFSSSLHKKMNKCLHFWTSFIFSISLTFHPLCQLVFVSLLAGEKLGMTFTLTSFTSFTFPITLHLTFIPPSFNCWAQLYPTPFMLYTHQLCHYTLFYFWWQNPTLTSFHLSCTISSFSNFNFSITSFFFIHLPPFFCHTCIHFFHFYILHQ